MPKYTPYKVCGHCLYFTSFCTVEAVNVHASDRELSEPKAARFFVRADGSPVLKRRSDLTKSQRLGTKAFIKKNYLSMYTLWSTMSDNGFFAGV